ncbi:MAG: threonylcarbamoyl-AMP synthase [Labilithrix sp.]|nr:threonylcarbamoyl-AMP synthase [Labilithrix sp.]
MPVSRETPEPEVILAAAEVLARGGLVAFPTETVYGLGARGLRADEVEKIFVAKQRPSGHPLILHVDGEAMASALASRWSDRASRLARAFWPGPLTLVVPRAPSVPDVVTGGLATVGLRMPRHPVALALIARVGEPLAAPSANAHMHVSPTMAAHVVQSLGDRVDLVLDAGPCDHGIESTVIDLARDDEAPRVLRAGAASLDAIRAVVPEAVYEPLTVATDVARASPGLASKHYAPRARVVLVDAPHLVDEHPGLRVGAIVWSEEARALLAHRSRTVFTLPPDPEAFARALFATFYEADAAGLDLLLIERVPATPPWWAVTDRLARASS